MSHLQLAQSLATARASILCRNSIFGIFARTILKMVLAALGLLMLGQAQAQTVVTGTLASSTLWRAEQSPYVIQGEVIIDGGATLSIEPGVLVRMAPGAGFTLKRGALQAVGTPSKPIVITSQEQSPAPGDWRQWRLTAGTDSALTQLAYLTMEYGSGLVIEGASPVIHDVAINHQSGPAISMDLASSPVGSGNSASGNSINAIAVPAGTIRTAVVWGVVGIPYLVQQGLVNVGQAPLSLEPAALKLSPGVVALLRVSLNAPAAIGGVVVDVTSSVPSTASAVSRVTIPAGQTGADLEIQASTVGTTRITASNARLGFAETQVEVVNLPSLSVVPSSPTVGVNRAYAMALALPAPAPIGGVVVQLNNSDPAVLSAPSSLLVPSGLQGISFEVSGLVDGTSRITAQAQGYASALATIAVRGKALVLPSSVIVAPNGQTTVTIESTEPAPASGLTVSLILEQAGLAQIPATVQIAAGQSKASFVIEGKSLGTTNLTATASGYQTTKTVLRVDVISLGTDPSADVVMNVEQMRTLRVLLGKVAPQGGVKVSVSSRDPAIASVTPAEVVVPEGQVYATVPVVINALAIGQTTLDIASPGLIAKAVNIDVREKFALQLMRRGGGSKLIVGKGLITYYYEFYVQRVINGVVSGGADAVTVNLHCVSEAVCTTPATVTIPAGQSQTYVQVTGVDVGSTQIEATAQGATAATPIPVDVILPQLTVNSLDGQRTTSSTRDDFSISLSVPGAYYSGSQGAASPLTVNLSLTDQTPAGVVNGFYDAGNGGNLITQLTISQGSAGTNWGYVAQPSAAGTYRVSATIAGAVSVKSEMQTVTAANQALKLMSQSGSKLIVGKGLITYYYELYVQRVINGVVSGGADAVTVNLHCVSEAVCTTPATVTIPAGQSQTYVQVTGVDVGSTQIEATAAGFETGYATSETITPNLTLLNVPTSQKVGTTYNYMAVSAEVQGAYYATSQVPSNDLAMTFTSSVPSIGSITSTVNWPANSSSSAFAIFTAVAPGTTQITASIPGFAPATSAPIAVTP